MFWDLSSVYTVLVWFQRWAFEAMLFGKRLSNSEQVVCWISSSRVDVAYMRLVARCLGLSPPSRMEVGADGAPSEQCGTVDRS